MSFKRRNTLWLGALSVLTALVLVSNSVSAEAQAIILSVFVLALAASFFDLTAARSANLMQSLQQRSPLNRNRVSPQAREAISRASHRAGYYGPNLELIDIGLIASQTGRDGMAMRRTRTISKDDDGVRPFITLNVTPEQADRNANMRFEIIDQNGKELYIYEMRVYLRDGEVNVLADNHLPLMKNENVAGVGDWDLRVYIDNDLVGIHNFALTASYEERRQRLYGERSEYYITESEHESEQEMPLSLEELLRNQSSGRS